MNSDVHDHKTGMSYNVFLPRSRLGKTASCFLSGITFLTTFPTM